MEFRVFLKTPANLNDVGRIDSVEIEIEAELLEKGEDKRMVFDRIEVNRGTESGVCGAKVSC